MGQIGSIYFKDEDEDKKKAKTPSQVAREQNNADRGQIGSIRYSSTYKPVYAQEPQVALQQPVQEVEPVEQESKLKTSVDKTFDVIGNIFKAIGKGELNKAATINSATQKSIKKQGDLLASPYDKSALEQREYQVIKQGVLKSSSKVETQAEVLKRKQDNPIEYLINRPYAKTDEGYLSGDVDKTPMEVMNERLKTAADFYNSLSKEDKIRILTPDFVDEDTFYATNIWADDTIGRLQREIDLIDKQLSSGSRVVETEYQTQSRGNLSDKDRNEMENRKEQLQEYIGGLEMVKKGDYTKNGWWEALLHSFDEKEDLLVVGDFFKGEKKLALMNAYGKMERGEELSERQKMLIEEDDIGDTIDYLTNEYTLGYEITTGLVGSAKLMAEIYLVSKLFTLLGLGVEGIALGTAADSSKVAQVAGNLLRSTVKAGQITLTSGAGRVITEAAERQTPVFQYYWQTGERVKTKEGESPREAWTRALALEYGNNFIEVGLGIFDDPTNSVDNFVASLVKEGALDSFPEEFTEEVLQKLWEEAGINNKRFVLPMNYTDSESEFTFTPRELFVTAVTTLLLGNLSSAVAGGKLTEEEAQQVRKQLEVNMQEVYDKADGRTEEEFKEQLEQEKEENPVDGTDYDGVIEEVGTGQSDRFDELEADIAKEEEMLKADIAQVEQGLKAEPVQEVKIEEGEVKTDYSQDAQVQEVLRDISLVLDAGARKKVVSKVEGSEGMGYDTEDYTYGVEGMVIPEFIPEELRSRKIVEKAYDAFLNNTIPQEGTKAWQVYQAILDESKGREGVQMQEPEINKEPTVKQQPKAKETPVKSETVIPKEGEAFEFSYVRNLEKAPNMGARFGQDIEPSGRYMTVGTPSEVNKTLETGVIRFENPLVIDFGGGYTEKSNWKNVLSKRFGNKKGKELSNAIRDAGYDGIVTVSESGGTKYTSEIVDLTQPKTQKEQVKEVLKEGEAKSIKQIAQETKILEPNIRRILGVGAKEGTFERVGEGVYVLTKGNEKIAYIQAGDAKEVLPQLAKDGLKADMIFLDIPYKTAGVIGGNRGIDYDKLSKEDFENIIVPAVKTIARNDDSPIVYMFSNSKTGMKDMVRYNKAIIDSGLQIVAKGTYTKTYKDGTPMKFGKYLMPPEGILIFNKSGRAVDMPSTFDIKAVAPLYKGHYQTEKAQSLLEAIIKGTTKVGDTVLDPFAGSGVSAEQAVKAGRKAVAIEIDKEAVEKRIIPRVEKASKEVEGLVGENQKRFTYKEYEFITTEVIPRSTPSPVPLDTSKKVLMLYGQTEDGWTFVENKTGLEPFTDKQLDEFIGKYKDRLIKPRVEKASKEVIEEENGNVSEKDVASWFKTTAADWENHGLKWEIYSSNMTESGQNMSKYFFNKYIVPRLSKQLTSDSELFEDAFRQWTFGYDSYVIDDYEDIRYNPKATKELLATTIEHTAKLANDFLGTMTYKNLKGVMVAAEEVNAKKVIQEERKDEDVITDDDLPFRQRELKVLEDKFLDNLNIERMKEFSREWFGDENVEVVKNILRNKKALGMYLNRLIEIKNGQAHVGSTFYHEAVHKAFDIFLTPAEKKAMVSEVIKRVGKKELLEMYNSKSDGEKAKFREMYFKHGTKYDIVNGFNLDYVGKGEGNPRDAHALYLTENILYAKDFANSQFGRKDAKVYDVKVDIDPAMMLRFGTETEGKFAEDERFAEDRKNPYWKEWTQRMKILDGLMDKWKEDNNIDYRKASDRELRIKQEQKYRKNITDTTASMEELYNQLSLELGSKKNASEFLASLGFDGILQTTKGGLTIGLFDTGKIKDYEKISNIQEAMYRGGNDSITLEASAQEWLAENIIDYINNRNSTTFWGKLKRMVDIFVDRVFRGIDHVKDIEDFYESLISGRLLDRQEKIEAKRIKNFNKYLTSIAGAGTKTDAVYRMEVAKEVKKLTTKILKKLEGKASVKKQFISDLTKQQDIKQVEKDIINDVLKTFPDEIDVATFEEKVLAELLPLKRAVVTGNKWYDYTLSEDRNSWDYSEAIYYSPVPTMAGSVHFKGEEYSDEPVNEKAVDNYFGHIRIQTSRSENIRRIPEVQNDLYQRGRIENETTESKIEVFNNQVKNIRERLNKQIKLLETTYNELKLYKTETSEQELANIQSGIAGYKRDLVQIESKYKKQIEKMKRGYKQRYKLSQYNNPTAHFRTVREEIRQAVLDGMEKILFPSGETAMHIEHLAGQGKSWVFFDEDAQGEYDKLTKDNIKVGSIIIDKDDLDGQDYLESRWVVAHVFGDTGDFIAVPAYQEVIDNNEILYNLAKKKGYYMTGEEADEMGIYSPYDLEDDVLDWDATFADKEILKLMMDINLGEQFNTSDRQEINKEHGTYLFYENTLSKYLKSNYEAKLITDKNGYTWWEVELKPEYAGAVEAFRLDELVDYGKVAKNLNKFDKAEFYRKSKQYLEDITKGKAELIGLMSTYKTKQEFLNDMLFHGSSEGAFDGKFTGGGYDGVFIWTTDSPKTAQNYIPSVGGKSFFSFRANLDDVINPSRFNDDKALQELFGLKFEDIKWDSSGRYAESWRNLNPVTEREAMDKLKKLGYTFDKWGGIEQGLIEVDGKIQKPDYKETSELYIFSGKRNLNLKDIRVAEEGDLMDVDYNKFDEFKKAKDEGYDGVIINDFGQSDLMGNYNHTSFGLFEKGYKKLQQIKVPAQNFDEWDTYKGELTPELDALWSEAHKDTAKYRLEEEVSVKLPELITMAEELGANIKLQNKFRKAGKAGDFTAGEDTDSRIRILRTLFEPQGEEVMDGEGNVEKLPETPEQQMDRIHGIEKVLAHEIGHLFDWFGGENNMTLKRGNILGRIANLRSYTEGQFMDLENKEVRKELKTLTQVWNPFDEASVPKKYKTYRYSAKELYAEALSVFLNKPSLVKEVAPNFYQGFVEYMARKKEVQKEYFAIRDMIKQGNEVQSRVENMKKAQEIARGKRMTIDEEKEAYRKQSKWQEGITGIKMGFVNQYAPYLDKLRKAWKDKKITLSKLEEAEQLMGDLALKGNDAVKYAQDVQDEFFVPVSEAGIDMDTVGQILVLERNLGDRLDLANPHGLVYDYAKETYDYVKGQLSPAQWNLLSEKLSWWRDYNFELVKKGYEAGVYSEKFFEEIATVNKNTYTPFAVVDYIEDNYVTAGVIQAVGTTKGVENPLTTQMLKSLSLMKLTATNGAKQDVVKSLSEIFPDEIVKADAIKDADGRTIGFKKNPKLERSGYTQLELLEDGKRTAYYMDKYIVSMFESSLNGVGWEIARFVTAPLRMVNRIFKPAVTVMKASFQFYSNPLKDYQRSLTNLTALSGLFDKSNVASRTAKVFGAFTKEWVKNLKRSWNYAGGEIDAVTQKMLDMYVLSSNVKYEDIDIGNEKFKFDPVKNRIVYKGGVNWLETLRDWGSTIPVIKHTLVPVYDFYMRAGSTFEVNSKIAGFQYLSNQVGDEKASFYTRRYVGTPDYMQKGKFTPLTNELVVFSNVGIQAITADMDLATRPKTASGYWVSTMFKIVFPKLLMLLGASILRVPIPDPDDEDKKIWVNPYDYLSEYYKSMYMAFPIGYDKESESFMFVKAPSDEVGAVIGNLVWKMATYLQGEGMKVEQLGSAIAGLIPFTTGDNPLLSIGRDWMQYAQGRNPYDDFRGRLAINTSKWNEGGMTRFTEMLKWTGNEMGLTNFSTYDNSSDTTLEKTMNLPLLERMFELTNYGLQEREENDKALGKKEKNKTLDGYIESYYAEPSNKKLLELQEKYVIAIKGERPKGGWSGTEKAEETRLKSEFKREVLANSGNAQFTSIAKSGLNNDEKIKIMDTKTKNSSDSQKAEYLSQVVKYEVVKGELFAQYAKDKDLSDRVVYEVVKQSIPVLSAESNNDLLRELRQAGVLSDRSLAQLRNDGLITPAGYNKYRAIKGEEVEQQQSGRIKRPERQYF